MYVRRCNEAERAEQKNDIYTRHSADERGFHPVQNRRLVLNNPEFVTALLQITVMPSSASYIGSARLSSGEMVSK